MLSFISDLKQICNSQRCGSLYKKIKQLNRTIKNISRGEHSKEQSLNAKTKCLGMGGNMDSRQWARWLKNLLNSSAFSISRVVRRRSGTNGIVGHISVALLLNRFLSEALKELLIKLMYSPLSQETLLDEDGVLTFNERLHFSIPFSWVWYWGKGHLWARKRVKTGYRFAVDVFFLNNQCWTIVEFNSKNVRYPFSVMLLN